MISDDVQDFTPKPEPVRVTTTGVNDDDEECDACVECGDTLSWLLLAVVILTLLWIHYDCIVSGCGSA